MMRSLGFWHVFMLIVKDQDPFKPARVVFRVTRVRVIVTYNEHIRSRVAYSWGRPFRTLGSSLFSRHRDGVRRCVRDLLTPPRRTGLWAPEMGILNR